jgi:hypothetical protein
MGNSPPLNVKLMKTTCLFGAGLLLISEITSLQAAVIGFQPSSSVVPAGSTVQIELAISGLGLGTAPSLGVFDLDVTYDPSILSFDAVAFGDPGLGDELDLGGFGSVTGFDSSAPGVINHFELSLDTPADLDNLQADAFTLSVFSFTALAPGFSSLDIVINALGDSLGDPLSASVLSGGVTAITTVPEAPGGEWALALGAIFLGTRFFQRC